MGDAGLQIDLLIQTRRAMYVVEIKRQWEIGREVEHEVEQKVERLGKHTGRSVRTSLVYEGHLAPIVEADYYFDFHCSNPGSHGPVALATTLDDLFRE